MSLLVFLVALFALSFADKSSTRTTPVTVQTKTIETRKLSDTTVLNRSKGTDTTHKVHAKHAKDKSFTSSIYSNSLAAMEGKTTTNPHTPIPPQPSKCILVTAS